MRKEDQGWIAVGLCEQSRRGDMVTSSLVAGAEGGAAQVAEVQPGYSMQKPLSHKRNRHDSLPYIPSFRRTLTLSGRARATGAQGPLERVVIPPRLSSGPWGPSTPHDDSPDTPHTSKLRQEIS